MLQNHLSLSVCLSIFPSSFDIGGLKVAWDACSRNGADFGPEPNEMNHIPQVHRHEEISSRAVCVRLRGRKTHASSSVYRALELDWIMQYFWRTDLSECHSSSRLVSSDVCSVLGPIDSLVKSVSYTGTLGISTTLIVPIISRKYP